MNTRHLNKSPDDRFTCKTGTELPQQIGTSPRSKNKCQLDTSPCGEQSTSKTFHPRETLHHFHPGAAFPAFSSCRRQLGHYERALGIYRRYSHVLGDEPTSVNSPYCPNPKPATNTRAKVNSILTRTPGCCCTTKLISSVISSISLLATLRLAARFVWGPHKCTSLLFLQDRPLLYQSAWRLGKKFVSSRGTAF